MPPAAPERTRQAARIAAALWFSAALHAAWFAFEPAMPGLSTREPAVLQIHLEAIPSAVAGVDTSAKPTRSETPHADPVRTPTPPARRQAASAIPATGLPGDEPLAGEPDATRADLRWHPVRELDTPPVLLTRLALPSDARPLRVRVRIDSDGTVSSAERVPEAEPASLDSELLASLRAARFRPATRNAQAVRCELVIELGKPAH